MLRITPLVSSHTRKHFILFIDLISFFLFHTVVIPMVTMYVVTAHISTKRLQKFFMADELQSAENRSAGEEDTRNASGDAEVSEYSTQGKFRGDFKTQLPVSRLLSLFRTIETGWCWTELPVNQRLGFEVIPYSTVSLCRCPIEKRKGGKNKNKNKNTYPN